MQTPLGILENKKIGIVNFTVGNWELLGPHIESMKQAYPYTRQFFILPNVDYAFSFSGLMNMAFDQVFGSGCDYMLYCSDDVLAGKDSGVALVETLISENLWMVNGVGKNSGGWDYFAASKELVNNVGYFDEGFYPAYFEDNDYSYRFNMICEEIGQKMYRYIDVDMNHIGSATVNGYNQNQLAKHHEQFNKNRERYIAKWGGPPAEEAFRVPWGGTNA